MIDSSSTNCYKLVRSRSHYYFANNECRKDGGVLVQIGSDTEDRYIWYKYCYSRSSAIL